jgi:hypothetical protein
MDATVPQACFFTCRYTTAFRYLRDCTHGIPAQTHGLQSLDISDRYSDSKSIDFIIINGVFEAGLGM